MAEGAYCLPFHPFPSETGDRYRMGLYRSILSRLMGFLYPGLTLESYCLKADKNLHPVRYLERTVFWQEKTPYLFAFSLFPVYIISRLWFFCFTFTVEAHWNRYISANQSVNPPSEKSVCYTHRWNVSGWIVYFTSCRTLAYMCIAALGGAYRLSVWKRSAFYLWMLSRQAGFHSEELMESSGGRFPDPAIQTARACFSSFFIFVRLVSSAIISLFFCLNKIPHFIRPSVLLSHSQCFLFPEV